MGTRPRTSGQGSERRRLPDTGQPGGPAIERAVVAGAGAGKGLGEAPAADTAPSLVILRRELHQRV